ncbi:MAG TPA: NAD(P)H-hydrate dehydratase [Dermatophilaceae bacterium]|nr:NAD(P)H-hydrate dehydratase [Dermatophilaceae bacterium]
MPVRAWSVADVRAAEAAAMARLPEGELMARASRALARLVSGRLDPRGSDVVVVLVGPGNNGGDALFAAALLARTDLPGRLSCVLTFPRAHAGGLAAVRAAGIPVLDAAADPDLALAELSRADLVLDGIAGIGGRPGLPPQVARLVEAVPESAYVVAVDLPSGLDPAGEVSGPVCLPADQTVTFGVAKPVHVLVTAPLCGEVRIVDIGLDVAGMPTPSAERLLPADVPALWPVPGPADDKYRRGVLGVVAGGEGYSGAALLTVLAAVCAGAGMVRYVGPPTPSGLIRAQVPEVVHGAPTGSQRVQAWVVGPGLDPAEVTPAGRAQSDATRAALAGDLPCVVDAGGLDLLDGPRPAAGAVTLLTPHAGELARLLTRLDAAGRRGSGRIGHGVGHAAGQGGGSHRRGGRSGPVDVADVQARPVEFARRAADLLHATVLLKGSTTLVVPPSATGLPIRAQADAPAWLATAGAGDVLAGLVGMLLAAGLDPLNAGSLAALVHGLAAHQANPGGPIRAMRVAQAIPKVVAGVLQRGVTEG